MKFQTILLVHNQRIVLLTTSINVGFIVHGKLHLLPIPQCWYQKNIGVILLLTNNITESQLRLLVQGENANHLNKSIAFQIRTLIDITLPRHDTVHDATQLARLNNHVNTSKGKLLNCIMKGLCLVKTRKVSLIPNWAQHGWGFVTSEDKKQSGNDHAYSLNEASENLLS